LFYVLVYSPPRGTALNPGLPRGSHRGRSVVVLRRKYRLFDEREVLRLFYISVCSPPRGTALNPGLPRGGLRGRSVVVLRRK
jgi:hypothetical protein